jgi:hypothetical protein
MRTSKGSVVLACAGALATGAIAASASASAPASRRPASGITAEERASDEKLLEALVKRRAEVASSATAPESKRAALDFLDRQIAKVRAGLGA